MDYLEILMNMYDEKIKTALRMNHLTINKGVDNMVLVYGDGMEDIDRLEGVHCKAMFYNQNVDGVIAMTEEQYEEFVLTQNIEKRFWRDLPGERT